MSITSSADAGILSFQDTLENVQAWLLEAEEIMEKWAPIGHLLHSVKKQFNEQVMFMSDLMKHQNSIKNVLKEGNEVIAMSKSTEEEKNEIRVQMGLISCRWEFLQFSARDRHNRLQKIVIDLQQHQFDEIASWLTQMEGRINNKESLGPDLESIKRQVNEHKRMKEELEEQQVKVNSLQDMVVVVDKSVSGTMERQRESLGKKWAIICQWAAQQTRILKTLPQKWQNFDDKQTMFADWLTKNEQVLGRMRLADLSNTEEVMVQSEELKTIEQDMVEQGRKFGELEECGQQIVQDVYNQKTMDKITFQLSQLHERWEKLVQEMEDLGKEIALKEQQVAKDIAKKKSDLTNVEPLELHIEESDIKETDSTDKIISLFGNDDKGVPSNSQEEIGSEFADLELCSYSDKNRAGLPAFQFQQARYATKWSTKTSRARGKKNSPMFRVRRGRPVGSRNKNFCSKHFDIKIQKKLAIKGAVEMATSEKLTENYLTCIICADVFTNPTTLHCDHTFCRLCLVEYTKTQPEAIKAKSIPCPSCRQMTRVTSPEKPVEDWVNQVKPSRLIQGLMKDFGPGTDSTESAICEVCKRKGEATPATSWCTECEECLCVKCVKMHQLFSVSRTHDVEVFSTERLEKKKANFLCSEHSDEQVKLLCKDCKKAICHICCSISHRQCLSVVALETVMTEVNATLEKKRDDYRQRLKLVLQQLANSKEEIVDVTRNADIVEAEINQASQMIQEEIRKKERTLLDELAELKQIQMEDIRTGIKSREITIQGHQQKIEFIDLALKTQNRNDMFVIYESWRESADDTNKDEDMPPVGRIKFRQDMDQMSKTVSELQIGNLQGHVLKDVNYRESSVVLQKTIDCMTSSC